MGKSLSLSNFGVQSTVASNASRGVTFCVGDTTGWAPSSLVYDKAHAGASPAWSVTSYGNTATAVAAFAPVLTAPLKLTPTTQWYGSVATDLTAISASGAVATADTAAGACYSVRAIFNPGSSSFGGTNASLAYSA